MFHKKSNNEILLDRSPDLLKGMFCYLIGAMDHAPDSGLGWRTDITPYLENMGVIVLNPCKKEDFLNYALESDGNRQLRVNMKESEDYDTLSKHMKLIRTTDLRLVDISGFVICYLDLDIPTCGTWEELFTANRQKKPILLICKQGKKRIPDWLFGTIPHEFMFDSWDDLKQYLDDVNAGREPHKNRWVFFSLVEKMKTALNGV